MIKFNDIPKFKNMIPIEDEIDGIIKGTHQGYCRMCGEPTFFIDLNIEGYFCSEECLDNFYCEYWDENK